ncbi:Glycine cleavage system H protein [Rosistilla oblonga]|uniref:glycine cleavage system protein GcvH n=1 Tax=Rosistilla oblonga TaxID=2527990 RepID=UPI00118B892C|nr:glycine cleavage system protein GcvH [Rosistilla oblonga]QDV10349.1 Glycine cleavage system H protein [Rosistilla oblonga]
MNQEELLYAETHEWVHVESGVATIGITAFAAEQLTDLVYMELPEVGRQLNVGEEFGEVESVKAVSPLYSPVAGEVIEINTELPSKLDLLGSDAFGAGWMIKVRVSGEPDASKLLNHEAYQKQCAEGN